MSVILPFRALRPHKKFVAFVASPPYDVVSVQEAREIVKKNPLSYVRVEKSEVDVPDPYVLHDDRIYKTARENLEKLIQKGVLYQDEIPAMYIYRQKAGFHEQYGIVARTSLAEYESGHIKKHELTRREKEEDRIKHILSVNAQTGLVFLVYRAQETLEHIMRDIVGGEPEYDFIADDGVTHTVWVVQDQERIGAITREFEKIETLYIADGHHRAAAAAAVRRRRLAENPNATGEEAYNYLMAALFPHNQLRILSYNRVVKDLNGLSAEEFLRRVGEKFDLQEWSGEYQPESHHEMGMYFRGAWYRLKVKQELSLHCNPLEALDVSILHDHILQPVLGVHDPRTDRRIDFVSGSRTLGELKRRVDSGQSAVAFSLFPTSIEQLMALSDEGRILPPKSTWFEPKLRSGIFTYPLSP